MRLHHGNKEENKVPVNEESILVQSCALEDWLQE